MVLSRRHLADCGFWSASAEISSPNTSNAICAATAASKAPFVYELGTNW